MFLNFNFTFMIKFLIKNKIFFIYTFSIFSLFNPLFSESILTFDEAVFKVLNYSPKLKVVENEVQEMNGLRIQSSYLPNPLAGYSVENIFGNKNWQGFDAAESRYEIAQLVELGGKRAFRYQTAKLQYFAVQVGFKAKQIFILNQLLKLFITVVANQESIELAKSQMQIANEVFQAVSAKVEAGKVSLLQQNKAKIALTSAQLNLQKTLVDFLKNKERLAYFWGSTCPDFDKIAFPFYNIDQPHVFENYLTQLKSNPELYRSHIEHLAAHQNLNLQKSIAIPDITISLGYKTLQDTGHKGLMLGASIPIPLFNRNQGNIEKAKAQTRKTYSQYKDLELSLENKLSLAHKELIRTYQEVEMIQTTMLKAASQSFELAKEGYQEGKFEYLEMLDSQKTLFEVRENYIQSLLNYHKSVADIEYLSTEDSGL